MQWELLSKASDTACLPQPELTWGELNRSKAEPRQRYLLMCCLHPSCPMYGVLTPGDLIYKYIRNCVMGDLTKTSCVCGTSQDLAARSPGNGDGLNAEMGSGNV